MTREEAKNILEEVKALDDSVFQYNQDYLEALDIAIKALEEQMQEPKTGQWEKTTDEYCYWYRCSCCGTEIPKNEWGSDYFSPYCPECGMKLIGPHERET